uniref:Protein PHLOEM PROTEIN 2-LIKE A9-like isoform X1 n=1 Tax=Cicer arietinum TaxID=3827 RepID=A0A3Q7YBW6_CICAR|nr:protein PHLOEM PROTEIN 2-LIKE A9-like isoform X1 [Cicer arietinum]
MTNGAGKEILPKGLNIIWGNDLRYWKITEQSAELLQVSWLEVSGKVKVDKGNSYLVKFDVTVKENGFGWDNTDVLVMAKIGKKGPYKFKAVNLKCGTSGVIIPPNDNQLKIEVDQHEKDLELHFGLYEVWSGKWKGGLIINKAEVVKVGKI